MEKCSIKDCPALKAYTCTGCKKSFCVFDTERCYHCNNNICKKHYYKCSKCERLVCILCLRFGIIPKECYLCDETYFIS